MITYKRPGKGENRRCVAKVFLDMGAGRTPKRIGWIEAGSHPDYVEGPVPPAAVFRYRPQGDVKFAGEWMESIHKVKRSIEEV